MEVEASLYYYLDDESEGRVWEEFGEFLRGFE